MTLLLSLFKDKRWFKKVHAGRKLARNGFMTVNFVCQFSHEVYRLNIPSGCVYRSLSGEVNI